MRENTLISVVSPNRILSIAQRYSWSELKAVDKAITLGTVKKRKVL